VRLSLAMIVRNAEETIRPCLLSVVNAVDEIVIVDTGSTDGTIEAIASVAPHTKLLTWDDPDKEPTRGWISDFSKARNMSFAACTGDAILWLDADDVLEHKDEGVDPAASLRALVETFFCHRSPAGDFIELRYDYKRDDYGNTLLNLPRYRIVRNGCFEWVYPVHEDLKPLRFVHMVSWGSGDQFVLHRKRDRDERASAERNLWIMERYSSSHQPMSQRLWSNMGGSYLALGDFGSAIACYDEAIKMGDAAEATYLDYLRRGDTYKKMHRFEEAKADFSRASLLFPKRRHPYIALAELSADAGDADKAIAFSDVAERLEANDEGFVQLTTALESVPIYSKARAYMLQGRYLEAKAAFEALGKRFPGAGDLYEHIQDVGRILDRQNRYGSLLNTAKMVEEPLRSRVLREAPEDLWTMPEIAAARRPPRPKKKPSLVIYCGAGLDPWGPSSLAKGVGGSEEAVVLLSRELAAMDWHVEVYAFPPTVDQKTDEHGVVWLPYGAFNPDEESDVFVGWRQYRHGAAFHQGLQRRAKQSWLWLHDAITPEYFDESWIAGLDGIFCLSEFAAKPLPQAFRHKLVLTKNGLNAGQIVDGPNLSLQFIFASSPDRGLEATLQEWPEIHRALPGSRLHVYYGFTKHYLAAMAQAPELGGLKTRIERLAMNHGVVWHGMVGQPELSRAFANCGFWLYPTEWPETSCITAMKAQAMGAIPITSRFPASGVPETCKYDLGPPARDGSIYSSPAWRAEWRAAVIQAAQTDHSKLRAEMKAWARKTYSWKAVARQWTDLFRKRSSAAAKAGSRAATPSPA